MGDSFTSNLPQKCFTWTEKLRKSRVKCIIYIYIYIYILYKYIYTLYIYIIYIIHVTHIYIYIHIIYFCRTTNRHYTVFHEFYPIFRWLYNTILPVKTKQKHKTYSSWMQIAVNLGTKCQIFCLFEFQI